MNEDTTISIDGVEHNFNDLSEKAQYFVTQIQKLQEKINEAKFTLDQYEVSSKAFTDLLKQELSNSQKDFVVK